MAEVRRGLMGCGAEQVLDGLMMMFSGDSGVLFTRGMMVTEDVLGLVNRL